MNIRHFFLVTYNRKMLILLSVAICYAFSAIYSYIIVEPRFRATAKIAISSRPSSQEVPIILDQDKLKSMVKNVNSAKIAWKELGFKEISSESARKTLEPLDVNVNSIGIVTISYRGRNPRQCAEIANAFARVFVEMNGKNAKNREKQIVKITEWAKEPAFPYYPDRRKIMIVGVILGFFAGIGIAIYFEENGIDEKINERVQRNSELPPSHIINFHNKYLNAIALIIAAIMVFIAMFAILYLANYGMPK